MKSFLLLLLILLTSQLFATPTKQIEKWRLYSQLDEISDELNSNDHSDKQVDTSLNILTNTLNILRGTVPDKPAQIAFKHSNPYVIGKLVKGAQFDFPVTIENSGDSPATSLIVSGVRSPFYYKGGSYPGTGGTCSSSLTPNSQCTLMLSTKADSYGQKYNDLKIEYYNGIENSNEQLTIKYDVVTAALLISSPINYDFGKIVTGGEAIATFAITNSGYATATNLKFSGLVAPYSFKQKSPTRPGAGTCKYQIKSGDSCYIEVKFSPTSVGVQMDTIELNYYNGLTRVQSTTSVTGHGVPPAILTISDLDPYDFGTVAVGGISTHIFTITNAGSNYATKLSSSLSIPFSYTGGSFPGKSGNCGSTLAPAQNCTIDVSFTPTTPTSASEAITLNYYDGANPQVVTRTLFGNGVSAAHLTISNTDPYDFGITAVGGKSNNTFFITNTGSYNATGMIGVGITKPFHYRGGGYPGIGGTCSSSLSPLATCHIVIEFAPTKKGVYNSKFTMNYSSGANKESTSRSITAEAVQPAILEISEANPYDFLTAAVGSTRAQTFTVKNNGDYDALKVSEVGLAAPFKFSGSGIYPGGGTCKSYIIPGHSCTIVVEYQPTTTGLHLGVIDLNYFNGTLNVSITKDLQGTGSAPANLTISEEPVYDFLTTPVGSTVEHTFTITNNGGTDATAMAGGGLFPPFGYKDGSYPGTAGTCTTQLQPNATCTIIVQYSPAALGIDSDTIEITYNGGVSGLQSTRDVIGESVLPAALSISEADPFDYGNTPEGGVIIHTFTLSNVGGYEAYNISSSGLTAPFDFEGGVFPGSTGSCHNTLAAGSTCDFVVEFSPISIGTFHDSININFSNGVNSQTLSRDVIANSLAPAKLKINQLNPYDFGTVASGSHSTATFSVTNTGSFIAYSISETNLSLPFEFSGGGYPGTGGNCASTLAPGASCIFTIDFKPTLNGTYNDSIEFSFFNGVLTTSTKHELTGIATSPATLTISDGPTYNFGIQAVNSLTEVTFTVTNSGNVDATSMGGTIAAPFRYKDGSYPGTGGDCGSVLNPSQNCSIVVTYEPTSTGAHSETIILNYVDGAGAQITARPIVGFAASAASLAISESDTFSFGDVPINGHSDHTFVVTNTGGISATGISATAFTSEFRFKDGSYPGTGGTCAQSLSPGVNCKIVVEFSPTSAGNQTDTITINYYDGVSTLSLYRLIDGDGRTPAYLSMDLTNPYDFGTIPVGSSSYVTFTVTNSGNYSARNIGASGIRGPFQFRGGGYPGLGGSCTNSLVVSASCTLVIEFKPTRPGFSFDQFDLNYNNGATPATVTKELNGTSVSPAILTISETDTYDYGSRPVGSTTRHLFTITNSGGYTATNLRGTTQLPFEFSNGKFPGVGTCTNAGLAPGSSCTVAIDFKPVSNVISLEDFTITYKNGNSKQSTSRLIEGTGINILPPVSPGSWSWNFIGIENGSTSSDNTPLLAAKNIDSSQLGNTISFYTNASCLNATDVGTITGTSLTQYFIFKSDGSDDGHKSFYAKVTDKNGYESTCDYIANYTLDTINLEPTNKKMKTTLLKKWTLGN